METNRRHWLKKIGIGVAGIGLTNFNSFALPLETENLSSSLKNDDDLIFLRSNENPYGPSPLARKAFAENVNISNRYNWDIEAKIISAIALKNSVKDENILLGAGSTEILDLVAKFVSLDKGNYVIADPSYDYWTVTLDNLGLTKNRVPLTTDKKINLQAMLEAVNQNTKLVYICNPNNPTGTICEREALIEFVTNIRHAPNFQKAQFLMQLGRTCCASLGDHRHHLPPGALLAPANDLTKQSRTQAHAFVVW